MSNSIDIADAITNFEATVNSIRMSYPSRYFQTPDRALEKHLSFFKHARENSDFEGIRQNARNLYNFFEDKIPHVPTRDSHVAALGDACKRIIDSLPR